MDSAPLALTLNTASRDAMLASLTSLKEVAQLGVDVPQFSLEGVGVDLGGLIALRADDLSISFEPAQRLLDLVAAVSARNVNSVAVEVEIRHNWPILSVVDRTTTVGEAAGESTPTSSASGGGALPA